MTKTSARTSHEPSKLSLLERAVDRDILDASTMELVWRLIGEGAAAELGAHNSLWRLVTERRALSLAWFEAERLDILAELVRRFAGEPQKPAASAIDGPVAAAALFSHLALLEHEELWVAYLNTKNIPLAVVRAGIGSVNSVVAFPSRIFREALTWNAAGIVVAHNHPSGDPTPSAADRDFTARINDAGPLVGINVVDNLIIGAEGRVYSFARHGEVR